MVSLHFVHTLAHEGKAHWISKDTGMVRPWLWGLNLHLKQTFFPKVQPAPVNSRLEASRELKISETGKGNKDWKCFVKVREPCCSLKGFESNCQLLGALHLGKRSVEQAFRGLWGSVHHPKVGLFKLKDTHIAWPQHGHPKVWHRVTVVTSMVTLAKTVRLC